MFVSFIILHTYRQKKYVKTISDVDAICAEIGIDTIKTNIIIEGGNVTRWTNKVIMTNRVFKDNPAYERKQIIKELLELFQVDKLYFVPELPGDFTGHSDGMLRFLDGNTVLSTTKKKKRDGFITHLKSPFTTQVLTTSKFLIMLTTTKATTRQTGSTSTIYKSQTILSSPHSISGKTMK